MAVPYASSADLGATVLEVVKDFDGDTCRAVYTIKFEGVVYVLNLLYCVANYQSFQPFPLKAILVSSTW